MSADERPFPPPTAARREVFRLFGELLDYPGPDTVARAYTCGRLLDDADAMAELATFTVQSGCLSLERLEEIYTGTFEINPASFIYAGYVLFGESTKRGALMVKLQEEYRRRGFSYVGELPDHLGLMLRFLATVDDAPELVDDLLAECVAPAIHQMREAIDPANPYAALLSAILHVIDPAGRATLARVLERFGRGFLPEREGFVPEADVVPAE
jgi:nitrate reductase delta subunit